MIEPQFLGDLPEEKSVFRLVSHKDVFLPPGALFPTGEAFRPSSGDQDEAKRRSMPILVSVWDTELTTVAQARAFRADVAATAYRLSVRDVVALGKSGVSKRLRVVADPRPQTDGPGAEGHAGIQGLERQASENRVQHKVLLDAVARLCVLMEGEVPRP